MKATIQTAFGRTLQVEVVGHEQTSDGTHWTNIVLRGQTSHVTVKSSSLALGPGGCVEIMLNGLEAGMRCGGQFAFEASARNGAPVTPSTRFCIDHEMKRMEVEEERRQDRIAYLMDEYEVGLL